MPSHFSFLSRLFGRARGQDYKLAQNYVLLRDMVFTTKPEAIGIVGAANSEDIWGVVMETGYPEAVATLVALADGSVSLYFSNGGGMIGMGSHEGPQRASRALLSAAPQFRGFCEATTKYPLPPKDHVRLYLFTHAAKLTTQAEEAELGHNRNPISQLFHQGHALIAQIRAIDEKRQTERAFSTDPPQAP